MKTLSITIDGVIHEYVKFPLSEESCQTCSLEKYCVSGHAAPHLCKILDLSGNCRPTGNYGRFEIINNE